MKNFFDGVSFHRLRCFLHLFMNGWVEKPLKKLLDSSVYSFVLLLWFRSPNQPSVCPSSMVSSSPRPSTHLLILPVLLSSWFPQPHRLSFTQKSSYPLSPHLEVPSRPRGVPSPVRRSRGSSVRWGTHVSPGRQRGSSGHHGAVGDRGVGWGRVTAGTSWRGQVGRSGMDREMKDVTDASWTVTLGTPWPRRDVTRGTERWRRSWKDTRGCGG